MKRVDLIKTIESFGCQLVRHGAKHDWYQNPTTQIAQPVPRHREIQEHLARQIIRKLKNPAAGQADSSSDDRTNP
jgi:mRNA interferase HicA